MGELKLKYNLTVVKWILFCGLLLGNFLLLVPNDDLLFIIIWEISVNLLAIGSFIAFSFLPRLYYIFNDDGLSYQNYNGKEYIFIPWDKVTDISYVYILGFIPDGLEIKWRQDSGIRDITLCISAGQAKQVYNSIPFVRDILDKSK